MSDEGVGVRLRYMPTPTAPTPSTFTAPVRQRFVHAARFTRCRDCNSPAVPGDWRCYRCGMD